MRIRRTTRSLNTASVLVVALMTALVLGLGLASYLTLVSTQNLSVERAQAWNAAMAVAEAGIEDAMAHLNPAALLFTTNLNRASDGWTSSGGYYRIFSRQIRGGSYDVAISSDTCPTIYSTGYVAAPFSATPLKRIVKVTTTNAALFQVGMAARNDIDFKGFRVETDSFNSGNSMYSTAGLYDVNKRRDHGDVATTFGVLNEGNGKLMGMLKTGPDGSYNVGAGGSVGDLGFVSTGNKGVQSGHYQNDFNLDFPDVLPPFNTGVGPASATINGTNYLWELASNDYLVNGDARPKTGDIIIVTGQARLFVTGSFLMSGSSKIIILPGANLEMYVAGASTAFTSINNGGNCSTFRYYGLPGNTSVALSGNDAFLGTIYAPNASFLLGGGGSTDIDFQGACMVDSIKMNGHFKFHFDENLKDKGPYRGLTVTSWAEL